MQIFRLALEVHTPFCDSRCACFLLREPLLQRFRVVSVVSSSYSLRTSMVGDCGLPCVFVLGAKFCCGF